VPAVVYAILPTLVSGANIAQAAFSFMSTDRHSHNVHRQNDWCNWSLYGYTTGVYHFHLFSRIYILNM